MLSLYFDSLDNKRTLVYYLTIISLLSLLFTALCQVIEGGPTDEQQTQKFFTGSDCKVFFQTFPDHLYGRCKTFYCTLMAYSGRLINERGQNCE